MVGLSLFNRISIRSKIFLINGLILTVVTGLLIHFTVIIQNNNRIIESQQSSLTNLSNAQEASKYFQQMRYWLSDLAVSWLNESEEYADSSYQQLLGIMPQLAYDDPSLKQEILENLKNYHQLNIEAVEAYVDENRVKGNSLMAKARTIALDIEYSLNYVLGQTQDNAQNAGTQVSESNGDLVNVSYILLTISLLVGAVFSHLLAQIISGPMVAAHSALANMSTGAGDLTRRLAVTGTDEIAVFGREFNEFVHKIQIIVRGTVHSAIELSGTADKLTDITNQTHQHVAEQKEETTQMEEALLQMAKAANDVASNASETAVSTTQANDEVSNGHQIVSDVIASIQKLETQVEHSAASITSLAKETENISALLSDIHDIADQTNLLALNAAIEAARAGDQGRGFSVVADEVRLLAQRTTSVTQNIRTLIGQLQQSAQESVVDMQNGRDSTQETAKLAKHAGESLMAINDIISKVAGMSYQIASAAEQQSATTEEVTNNIKNLSRIADDSYHCAHKTAETGHQLSELSRLLNEAVGKFTV